MLPIQDLQARDRAFHIHPFTHHPDMHRSGTHVMESAEGCWITDARGTRLLDALAGLWCVNVGYGCQEIIEAISEQAGRLAYYPSFFNSTTEPPILVAEFLAEKAPERLNRTVFSNSGSEANETALKAIRSYQILRGKPQKMKILTRSYAYHGVTLATTSMTGLPSCYEPFGLPLPGFLHVPGPYRYGAQSDLSPQEFGAWCLEETRHVIEREGPETIAAIFAEPIQGAGGVIVPPPGYLAGLRALAREHDILFVADEVITAFGRIGEWFASELWELDPDLLVLAKGLTSGYLPLGATMLSDDVAGTLMEAGYFAHGFTYSGHPTCAAAALANLKVIERDHLPARVADDVGPYFQKHLASFADHPAVAEVRGFGLIGALEVVPRGGRAALVPGGNLGVKASALIREENVIVRGIRDLIAMAPPLVITHDELDFLFAGVRRGLDRLLES